MSLVDYPESQWFIRVKFGFCSVKSIFFKIEPFSIFIVYSCMMENKQLDSEENPYFSIIIPTFNRKKTLTRAIKSLIAQTEQNWEAIIVDDGSDDDTFSHISSYLDNDSRIKYIRQKNTGAALAKNKGMESASGIFLTFLDSDDEYCTTHLESRRAILCENPLVQFLYGGIKIVGSPFVGY